MKKEYFVVETNIKGFTVKNNYERVPDGNKLKDCILEYMKFEKELDIATEKCYT